jgi:hypothetical protein
VRAAVAADTTPKTRAERIEIVVATARTGPSIDSRSTPGTSAGMSARMPAIAQIASNAPHRPPARPSAMLSPTSSHPSRLGEAPSAARVASSRSRSMPRASSRFATLAHAMSVTSPQTARSI